MPSTLLIQPFSFRSHRQDMANDANFSLILPRAKSPRSVVPPSKPQGRLAMIEAIPADNEPLTTPAGLEDAYTALLQETLPSCSSWFGSRRGPTMNQSLQKAGRDLITRHLTEPALYEAIKDQTGRNCT